MWIQVKKVSINVIMWNGKSIHSDVFQWLSKAGAYSIVEGVLSLMRIGRADEALTVKDMRF